MGSADSDLDWLRSCGELTTTRGDAGAADPLVVGARAASRLIALARALARLDAAHAHPLGTDRVAAEATELADALAAEGPEAAPADVPAAGLAGAYRRGLEEAAHAVYHCRLVQHAAGRCWFAERGPGADLCGRVLAVAHDLRAQQPADARR